MFLLAASSCALEAELAASQGIQYVSITRQRQMSHFNKPPIPTPAPAA